MNNPQKKNTNKFQPKEKQEQQDLFYTPCPLDVMWGIYPRQSTLAQLKNNTQSTEMQTEDPKKLLMEKGVKEGNIRLYDKDLGVSGTLRIDEREALNELVKDIEDDKVKAVFGLQISRFFRDESGIQYNTFAYICKEHNCILMTADGMIYNFNNPVHMKMFRFLAEYAAEYIPQHIKGVLHTARDKKARKGLYAGLGRVPTGYIVDYNENSKTYKKIIPYVSHKERVFSFFERFYMLQGNISQLYRELNDLSPLFPPFGPEVDKRNVSRWKKSQVPGGYNITRNGLLGILCNPVYIGWWIVEGDVISRENHERIIDKEHEYLFWYAFNRLSPHMTDGEENMDRQNRRKEPSRFFQKETDATSGILKFRISSPNYCAYFRSMTGSYFFLPEEKAGSLIESDKETVKGDVIDIEFTKLFFSHLREEHDLEEYRQWVKNEVQKHDALLSNLRKQLVQIDIQQESITEEITDIRAGIKEKLQKAEEENPEVDMEALKKALYDEVQPMIDKHRKKFTTLQTSKKEISKKLEEEEKNESIATIRKYSDLQTELGILAEVWDEKPMKAKREFVNLFVTKAVFKVVAPHWISLTIHWSHPAWNTETLYIHRQRGSQERWTDQDLEIIRAYYPNTLQKEILAMLPSKSWASIVRKANLSGLKRDGRKASTFPETITWADWQFMQEKGIALTDQNIKCEILSRQWYCL